MAVTVSFYNFSKKINSTAQPQAGSGTDIDCVLKEDSSLVSPRFQLLLGSMPSWNYASVYGRYYYVTDWTYVRNSLWECTLVTDILATYKTDIGASTLYVLRSSAAYDGSIVDTLYPAKTDGTFQAVTVASPFLQNVQSGTYVIGISSGDVPTYGTTTFWAVDSANLNALMQGLANDFVSIANGFSLNDATLELQKALINPFSYINSCIWYPLDYGDMPIVGTLHNINVGGIDIAANGNYINASSPLETFTLSWQIPEHPQAQARGQFMNAAYRKLFLEIPPFGSVELDASICARFTHVTAEITMDATSGKACIRIGAGNSAGTITELLEKYETMLGVPMQLSAVYRDMFNGLIAGASGVVGTVASAMTGNIGGAIAAAGAGIGDAMNTLKPRLQNIGGQGAFASFAGTATLYAQFIPLPAEDLSHVGRPLCDLRQLSSIPGFIQVMDGDINIGGFSEEAAYIKEQLEGGFFYE
jgi:hypothetical protein